MTDAWRVPLATMYSSAITAAAGTAEAPVWEAAAKAPAAVPVPGLSPNIRVKKKVGSLLGG